MGMLEQISKQMSDQAAATATLLAQMESAHPGIFSNPEVVRESILQLMRIHMTTASSVSVVADAMRLRGLDVSAPT